MEKKLEIPPPLAKRLIGICLDFEDEFNAAETLHELYVHKCVSDSRRKAKRWYWKQVLLSILREFWRNLIWRILMLNNYFKMALRHFLKYKSYAFINIAGLMIGMTCSLLILFYIRYELSYDDYHEHGDRIYRVVMYQKGNKYQGTEWFNVTPGALQPTVTHEIPEVLLATRARNQSGIIRHQEQIVREDNIRYADPEFLQIFTYPLISGNQETALNEPFSLLLTEEMAVKYFGRHDPVGKILNIDQHDFTITGVLKNVPANSHRTFDFLASFNTLYTTRWIRREVEVWGWNTVKTYILTDKRVDEKALEAKLTGMLRKHEGTRPEDEFHLQPLKRIHLHSNINFDVPSNSDVRIVVLFAAIAFLVMIIACLNYINLSTSRSMKRAREIGIRKVVGADKASLVRQFFSESLIFVVIASVLSLFLLFLLLPPFSAFIDRAVTFSMLFEPVMLLGFVGLVSLVGVISGIYPAFYLSTFRPVVVLKGKNVTPQRFFSLRNGFVVVQFIISITLTICALVVYTQLRFIMKKNLGFEKDHIIYGVAGRSLRQNIKSFHEALEKQTAFLDVYTKGDIPVSILGNSFPDWESKRDGENFLCYYGTVDYNFIDFFDVELMEGRNFSRDFSTDTSQAWILNEAAVKAIGWDNPIGKQFGWRRLNPDGRVIGVVKDFHNTTLHLKVEPMALHLVKSDRMQSLYAVKIGSENVQESIKLLESIHDRYSPDYPFRYWFLDERIDRMYRSEQKLGQIFGIFTGIALFISCLGILGLSSFMVEQRTKEVGIRKVLGASVPGVVTLLSRDFVKRILMANLVAYPIAYYAMFRWLRNFAYRVDLNLWMFLFSGLAALIVALTTVSYQTFKAASTNPVECLRYE